MYVTWTINHSEGRKIKTLCHVAVKKLHIGLYLVITAIPVAPPSTHVVQSLALTIQSPISIGPSCSSMTQKEVCQSTMWTSTMNVSVCILKSADECVCVLSCPVILNNVMFSYFFPSFPLDSSFCSAAPLCYFLVFLGSLFSLCVFLLFLSVSFSLWYLSKAAEHSGIPVKSFFWLFYSNCLCWKLFVFCFF